MTAATDTFTRSRIQEFGHYKGSRPPIPAIIMVRFRVLSSSERMTRQDYPDTIVAAFSGTAMKPAPVHPQDFEAISSLIDSIYACVVEPSRWEAVLDDIRRLLECKNCVLSVADMPRQRVRAHMTVGIEPYWRQRMDDYGPDIAAAYSAVPDMLTRPLDEPFVFRRDVPESVILANRYYREWAMPNGIVDVIQTFLIRTTRRNAALALGRHESVGHITEREIQLMRLIAPHMRRTVTISDLIDMQSLQYAALDATLDTLATGVVVVASDGAIVHVNEAAKRMLDLGEPIMSHQGRLQTCDGATTDRLKAAISVAVETKGKIAAAGHGVAIVGPTRKIATAHVLPLRRNEISAKLIPQAAAAVFVATEEHTSSARLGPVAEAYGLTRGELRLLARLVQGESLDEAAAALGIARTTVKTHLSRILAKTGTHRQTSLLGLVHRLAPAVGVAEKPQGTAATGAVGDTGLA